MEDSVRPSQEIFRKVYEKGYRTWASLWQVSAGESWPNAEAHLRRSLVSAFPSHPHFPNHLRLDKSFSNVVTATGRTRWKTTPAAESCELPPFEDEAVIEVAWRHATEIALTHDSRVENDFPRVLADSHHFPILFLAWAYVLSARWAELIPGAQTPQYKENEAPFLVVSEDAERPQQTPKPVVVEIGDADADAARWWAAILAAGRGWEATIYNDKGAVLHSPWSIRVSTTTPFIISGSIQTQFPSVTAPRPASLTAAVRYLSDYCSLHGVSEQSDAAFASALLVPVAKLDGRRISIPWANSKDDSPPRPLKHDQVPPPWGTDPQQLDRLMTLSSYPRGVKSLLSSIFFEPDIDCHTCGAWLQGSFAFLDSDAAHEPQVRLQMFKRRDPGLDFLWLGAFLTGAEQRCVQDARAGWWKVDMSSAGWTRTHVSFIQGPVHRRSPDDADISRADECRLLYLAQAASHETAPIFPFPPFGSTAVADTNLEVRQHVRCAGHHQLYHDGFSWDCDGGRKVWQEGDRDARESPVRFKASLPLRETGDMDIDYDGLDLEDDDEISEMVTRNVFGWLRGEDGFPVAERAIRQHEWIDNLDSDDDEPIEGDARSHGGKHLGSWLLGVMTTRCDSL